MPSVYLVVCFMSARQLTNLPVGDSPGVGHPVGDVRAPIPCSLGWWDGIEIRIGKVLRLCEAALFLSDFPCEVAKPSLLHGRVADGNVVVNGRSGWGAILLVGVHGFTLGGHVD